MPVPNYWTWSNTTLQKRWFFRSNPYKIKFMITSLVEMLELPNFGHIATSTILWRHGHKLWRDNLYFKITFALGRPRVAIFADIIKIVTIFTKAIFRDSKKSKELEITYQNPIYICISWYSKICWFSVKKCRCQQNSRGVSRDSYILWIFFR